MLYSDEKMTSVLLLEWPALLCVLRERCCSTGDGSQADLEALIGNSIGQINWCEWCGGDIAGSDFLVAAARSRVLVTDPPCTTDCFELGLVPRKFHPQCWDERLPALAAVPWRRSPLREKKRRETLGKIIPKWRHPKSCEKR